MAIGKRNVVWRGDLLKVIWHDGQGACLFSKRLERGRFIWPTSVEGAVTISSAQLGYLLEGMVEDLERWLRAERRKLPSKNPLAKAMAYSLNRWQAFTRFLATN